MLYIITIILSLFSLLTSLLFMSKDKYALSYLTSILLFASSLIIAQTPSSAPFLYDKIYGYVEDKYITVNDYNNSDYIVIVCVLDDETRKEIIKELKVSETVYTTIQNHKKQKIYHKISDIYVVIFILFPFFILLPIGIIHLTNWLSQ